MVIRVLGALFVSYASGMFCIKATEDIDSKRATLQVKISVTLFLKS